MLTLTKTSADKNLTTKLAAEKSNKNDEAEIAGERVWKEAGFFGNLRADNNMEKVNFPENPLIYINQAYLTVQKNKKIYCCDYFILGEIIEASNPPLNIETYELKENEVKYFRSRYNKETGKFLGVYENVGLLVVHREPDEIFLNYGYNKEKSKVLYSTYRIKIPNSFCGTIFNRHRTLIECEETDLNASKLYFFCHQLLIGLKV